MGNTYLKNIIVDCCITILYNSYTTQIIKLIIFVKEGYAITINMYNSIHFIEFSFDISKYLITCPYY